MCFLVRFRHFEELHRRLKEFPEYNLSLPPKHFLSSGLDVPVVQERCKLLDVYLKVCLSRSTLGDNACSTRLLTIMFMHAPGTFLVCFSIFSRLWPSTNKKLLDRSYAEYLNLLDLALKAFKIRASNIYTVILS